MSPILPNQDRARWAIIFLVITMLIELAFAGTQWWQASLIQSSDLTTEDAEQSDAIVGFMAIAYLLSMVACAIVFVMWFRRAYANLHRLENPHSFLTYTEGWAAGAWFTPFINLVRPYTIMKEIWAETQRNIPGKIERDGMMDASFIGWWWAAWITDNIVSNISNKIGGDHNVEEIVLSLHASALGSLLVIPAGLLAIQVVQKTSRLEQELYDAHHFSDPLEHLLS